jgi:acetolactate synthase-1/2/3 large subunit
MAEKAKVSDIVARFLKEKGIRHVFGIVGSANSHIFDSIFQLGFTQIVCVHHEQAATMAMQTYFRVSGKITAAIVTAGGGSANAITGVISAWADSFPGLIISGQENARYISSMHDMRMWGIQGFDSTAMVEKVTKYTCRILKPERVKYELGKAYSIAGSGRPGPVWLDFPMDVQGSLVEESLLEEFDSGDLRKPAPSPEDVDQVFESLRKAERPVLWLGNGVRLSGAEQKLLEVLELLQMPTLVSWAVIDMIDSNHPLVFGRAGLYGNRSANLTLQNADYVLAVGSRLSIQMIGYEHSELARAASITMVDIDEREIEKLKDRGVHGIVCDAGMFIDALILGIKKRKQAFDGYGPWRAQCNIYREKYPLVGGPEHEDKNGFINSYRFMDKLCSHLKSQQLVTTDMGTALLAGHEALRLKRGQRLMTSLGLGEMGFGLPAAIGASFATERGEVLCLNCDGGIMMNLQELQTVSFHRLPIKIIVFNNDGYLMIKHTQKNLFKGRYAGTDPKSGVQFPNFSKIAYAFDMPYFSIKSWTDFDDVLPKLQDVEGPALCEVFMDPEQYFYPKLSLAMRADGRIVSPPLEDLSPLLPRDELAKNMVIGLHPKSKELG